MGLSGRKVKQRIGADPRNLSWADDAARFGQNYLSKFGWDASKGLGAGGDGMKSHIKVSHKLDMLGIGAAQTKDPNGIAWKQNRDFEILLERLNKGLVEEGAAAPAPDAVSDKESDGEAQKEGEDMKKKKRKHKETEEDESDRKEKKKSKKSKNAETDQDMTEKTVSVVSESVQLEEVVEVRKSVVVPRHRAHRARAIAAKNISSKSAAHISEILGIAPDPTPTPPIESVSTTGKLTSVTETDALGMDKITTSTKSLADYFKEKLNARLGGGSGDSGSSTPSSSRLDEEDDRPRGGIGASRLLLEVKTETRVEEETQRVGLSKFSSLMSSQFLAAASTMSSYVPTINPDVEIQEPESSARISEVESSDSSSEEETVKAKEKKAKKEKKEKSRKHKKVEEEAEDEDKEVKRKKEKKSEKDKKGKRKAKEEDDVDEEEAAEVDEKTRRKLEKKAKRERKTKVEVAAEEEEKAASETEEQPSRKKEKGKHKSSKSSEPSAESEKSERKKERRKSRSGDS